MDLSPEEEEAWKRAWGSVVLRRVATPPAWDLAAGQPFPRGPLVSLTISADPPEFSDRVWRKETTCPLCGRDTTNEPRVAASLHPKFSDDYSIALGVWAHDRCLEECEPTDERPRIPW
jgi:hypothetical protein